MIKNLMFYQYPYKEAEVYEPIEYLKNNKINVCKL